MLTNVLITILIASLLSTSTGDFKLPVATDCASSAFAVAFRNGEVVVGGMARIASYQENNLLTLHRASPEWLETYRKNEDLVSLFWWVYNAQRDHERRVTLALDPEARLKQIPTEVLARGTNPNWEEQLGKSRLVYKLFLDPWRIVFLESPVSGPGKPLKILIALQPTPDGFRVARFNGGSTLAWLMTSHSSLDGPANFESIAAERLSKLECFSISPLPLVNPSAATEFKVDFMRDSETKELSKTEVRLYCGVQTGVEQGYALPIGSAKVKDRLPSGLRTLDSLLARSWQSQGLEDQKQLFLAKYFAQLENNHQRILASPMKPAPGAYQGVRVLTRGFIDQSARLLATIDGGVGYIHFFWNPPDAKLSPGKVVHVVVQEEDGVPKLGDSFSGEEAAVSEIFATEEFKAGLIEYLKVKHVDVLQKAGYPLP